jgi:hypothetical protein
MCPLVSRTHTAPEEYGDLHFETYKRFGAWGITAVYPMKVLKRKVVLVLKYLSTTP